MIKMIKKDNKWTKKTIS